LRARLFFDATPSPCLPSRCLSPPSGNKKTCHGIYQAGVFVLEVSLKGEF
jgi:hypothetical protein